VVDRAKEVSPRNSNTAKEFLLTAPFETSGCSVAPDINKYVWGRLRESGKGKFKEVPGEGLVLLKFASGTDVKPGVVAAVKFRLTSQYRQEVDAVPPSRFQEAQFSSKPQCRSLLLA